MKVWAPEVILHNSVEERFIYRQVYIYHTLNIYTLHNQYHQDEHENVNKLSTFTFFFSNAKSECE